MNNKKTWGGEGFWGLGFEFDPQWILTDEQKKLQATLIELCRITVPPWSPRPSRAIPETGSHFFGECLMDTNAARALEYQMMGQAMDVATNNCDWTTGTSRSASAC
ncbi:hypothetical protein ACN28S_64540 [Cystobacter fuscus]